MKDTKLDPTPKTIREFKRTWLRPEFWGHSDKDIKKLLKKIIKNDDKYFTLGRVTFKRMLNNY